MNDKIIKKNYGSIPHLSTSKMSQQADKKIDKNSELILTKKARDYKDLIIVTEKVDGSNVGIIKKDGELIAITRKGYKAIESPFDHHHYFHEWVNYKMHKFMFLPEGWRICGEWCVKAHGTIYNIKDESPFVAFDIIDHENNRMTFMNFYGLCFKFLVPMVPLIHIGQPITIKNAVKLLGPGKYGNPEKPEGLVYRVERENKVSFLAKWVRSDKIDGLYMKKDIYNNGFSYK